MPYVLILHADGPTPGEGDRATIHEDMHAALTYGLVQWGISVQRGAQTFTLLQKFKAAAEENGDRYTLIEAMDLRRPVL